MKWFKHVSDSLDDPFIFDLISNFGGDGYLVFFGILEILARENDKDFSKFYQFSVKFLSKKLQLSVKKLKKILFFIEENGRFDIDYNSDKILIKCYKLKDLQDEYSKKKIRKVSGQCPEKVLLDKDIDKDKDKEVKKELKKTTTNNISGEISEVVNFWNSLAEKYGFAKVEKITAKRKTKISARLKDGIVNDFERIEKAVADSWLINGDAGWFTFDWIIANDNNFTKLIEGNYSDKKNKPPKNKLPKNKLSAANLAELEKLEDEVERVKNESDSMEQYFLSGQFARENGISDNFAG